MNLPWFVIALVAIVIVFVLIVLVRVIIYFWKKGKNGENIKPELVAFVLLMILVIGGINRSPLPDTASVLATGPHTPMPTPTPSPIPSGDSIYLKLPVEGKHSCLYYCIS